MPLDAVIWRLQIASADAMVINFGVKKTGCGKSVGLVPFSAKYLSFPAKGTPTD
jgi:hypothetical protein